MATIVDSLRRALGDFRHRPVFAAAIVLTLAIGIGATSAAFTLVDAVFLTRLPVVDQDGLVVMWGSANGFPQVAVPWLDTQRFLLERHHALAAVSVFGGGPRPYAARDGDRTFHLTAAAEPAALFDLLGVKPAAGRFFRPEDDVPSARDVVVLSDALWHREFGGDPSVIGRMLFFNGATFQVVGVGPPEFSYPGNTEAWTPFRPQAARWGIPLEKVWGGLVGRLRPGLDLRAAQVDFEYALHADSATGKYIPTNTALQFAVPTAGVVERFTDDVLGREVRPGVIVLFAAAALVLLIGCTNVAGLLLARGISRAHELAVRGALGASRRQLLVQLLAESAVLGVAGGSFGVALAAVLVRVAKAFSPPELPMIDAAHLDARVIAFTVLVTVGSVIGFGLVPALRGSTGEGSGVLRSANRSVTAGRRSGALRHGLVAAQVALALIVLVSAGVLARTLLRLEQTPLGFDPSHLLFFKVDAVVPFDPKVGYLGFPTRFTALRDRVVQEFPQTAGLGKITTVYVLPLGQAEARFPYTTDGRVLDPNDRTHVMRYDAGLDDYFGVLKIPLLEGRGFTAQDDRHAPTVVVVNQALARQAWPGQNPLGHRIKVFTDSVDRWWTVVGVAADDHFADILGQSVPTTYFPARQEEWDDLWLVVRTLGDPRAAEKLVSQTISRMDSIFAVRQMTTGPEVVAKRLARPRALAVVFSGLAATALLLAGIGLFGVLSAYVRERRRELAVRSALGATPTGLRWLILTQTLGVSLVGLVCGVPLALVGAHLLGSLVSDVQPLDVGTVLAVAVVLLTVVAGATYGPMVRASRVDVRTALGAE